MRNLYYNVLDGEQCYILQLRTLEVKHNGVECVCVELNQGNTTGQIERRYRHRQFKQLVTDSTFIA